MAHGLYSPRLSPGGRLCTVEPGIRAAPVGIVVRLPTSQRLELVSPSSYLFLDHMRLHMGSYDISIVIPTLDRPQELDACLQSLKAQAVQNVQIILLTERGPLARLRNQGLSQAVAPVVAFIDDDVVCSRRWLQSLLRVFRESPSVVGVTGPAYISETYRHNRDIFNSRFAGLYNRIFVGTQRLPGYLTNSGTFVPTPDYSYHGPVQFLEACNMSFRTEALKAVGGFDEAYGGVGDWSEPDVCFRLREVYGPHSLSFDPSVALEHRPSRGGAYLLRRPDAGQRLANYRLFAHRWVTPTWRHYLYLAFLYCYYSGQARCPLSL